MKLFFALLAMLMLAGSATPQKPWWEQGPLRIIDLTTSISRIDYRDPALLARQKAEQGYDTEHLDIMQMPGGLDDQGFFFVSKVAGKSNPDYLKKYIAEAKKQGIRVFIYFNVHWYTTKFGEQHPDWRQIRENGKPLDGVYDTGTDFCVNTPWRKWCFQVLRDLAAYPIDGIFYDGPVYRPDTCYCKYCREKFRAKYGAEMPSKRVRRGREFKNLVDFQAASLADFLRDSNSILKSISPHLALYMNGGVRGSNWATGRLNRVLVPEQDLLGSEGGFISGDLTRVPLWKPGLTARLLETQAGGKPTVIFAAASHKPWTFSLLPAAELRLMYADSIANGASVWFGITPFEFDQPDMDAIAAMNRFVAGNADYYRGTRSEARLALVWSETTANFYAGAGAQLIDIDQIAVSGAGNLETEFSGFAAALARAHVPFDVIDDTALESEPLDRYSAIVLPNVACMSDRVAGRLREYVRNGGNLAASFETSMYDDTGIRRSDYALSDVFGAKFAGKIAGPMRWDFMKPMGKHALLAGAEREMIPSPIYHLKAKAATAASLANFTVPLAGRYEGVPAVSDDPALLLNRFGRGTVVYSSGDIGATIAGFHTQELLQFVSNVARQFAPPQVELENLPGSVELVVRSQNKGDRLLVHLVNFTGEMTRPIRNVVPLSGGVLKLKQGAGFGSASALVSRSHLQVEKQGDGGLRVKLPQLNEYEVVVLERRSTP